MDIYTMLLEWKNQYCWNDYIPQDDLQIHCNPYQITKGIFHRTRTKKFYIVWKHKRPWIAKTILQKKYRTGGLMLPYYTTNLQKPKQYGTGAKTDI